MLFESPINYRNRCVVVTDAINIVTFLEGQGLPIPESRHDVRKLVTLYESVAGSIGNMPGMESEEVPDDEIDELPDNSLQTYLPTIELRLLYLNEDHPPLVPVIWAGVHLYIKFRRIVDANEPFETGIDSSRGSSEYAALKGIHMDMETALDSLTVDSEAAYARGMTFFDDVEENFRLSALAEYSHYLIEQNGQLSAINLDSLDPEEEEDSFISGIIAEHHYLPIMRRLIEPLLDPSRKSS